MRVIRLITRCTITFLLCMILIPAKASAHTVADIDENGYIKTLLITYKPEYYKNGVLYESQYSACKIDDVSRINDPEYLNL